MEQILVCVKQKYYLNDMNIFQYWCLVKLIIFNSSNVHDNIEQCCEIRLETRLIGDGNRPQPLIIV